MGERLILSTLPKAWIFDLDGTILKHNGYKMDGTDSLLKGAKEYLDTIPNEDRIIILTSRTDDYRKQTMDYLKKQGIRFDEILFNMPLGERILVNDRKPSGLMMAMAVNVDRDEFKLPEIERKL
jgi:histidinol phosphatase-like enzyme